MKNPNFLYNSKIWDLFLCYGEVVLFKVALAIFDLIKNKILDQNEEDGLFYIRSHTSQIDQEKLLQKIGKFFNFFFKITKIFYFYLYLL
jgi:hypothetical protein